MPDSGPLYWTKKIAQINKYCKALVRLISFLGLAEAGAIVIMFWGGLFCRGKYFMMKKCFPITFPDWGTIARSLTRHKPHEALFLNWGGGKHTGLLIISWKNGRSENTTSQFTLELDIQFIVLHATL